MSINLEEEEQYYLQGYEDGSSVLKDLVAERDALKIKNEELQRSLQKIMRTAKNKSTHAWDSHAEYWRIAKAARSFGQSCVRRRTMSEWKPIDTAPKEGQFLVWGPYMTVFCEDLYSRPHNETGDVALVRYLEDPPRKDCGHLWVEHSVYYHSVVQGATHWMPVPKVSITSEDQ